MNQLQGGFPLVSALLLWPLVVAAVLLPVKRMRWVRRVALAGALVELATSTWIFLRVASAPGPGFQFRERIPWIDAIGASVHVGVDGLSAPFLPLTALLTVIAVIQTRTLVAHRQKAYLVAILTLSAASAGIFTALDLVLFFVFWELMLVPTFMLIKVWGTGAERSHAATKYVLAMLSGSVALLAALVLLAVNHARQEGALTFDYLELLGTPLPSGLGTVVFFLMVFAFSLKAPLFPLHSWLPPVLQNGPVGAAMLLGGLKVGAYAFLRMIVPLLPGPFVQWRWLIATLAVAAILYGGLAALVQPDLRRLIALAGVSHVGVALLGLSTGTEEGISGALFLLISMGFTSAGLLLLAGFIHQRLGVTDVGALGGLAARAPALTAFALFLGFAEAALPGTSGFPGEFLALLGAFRAYGVPALAAVAVVVLAAGYILVWLQRAFYGPVRDPVVGRMLDLGRRESLIALAVALPILTLGLAPSLLLDAAGPAVAGLVDRLAGVVVASP
ncbi:MAG: NuoM family protein [Actinomycetota bacterium]